MDQAELLRLKVYLESIRGINLLAAPELVKEWKAVYGIVYAALNPGEYAQGPMVGEDNSPLGL